MRKNNKPGHSGVPFRSQKSIIFCCYFSVETFLKQFTAFTHVARNGDWIVEAAGAATRF
jgi:hypothetical protein